MNKRIKKKKARGRTEQHVRALIQKHLTPHNGWRFETTRAKKRRVQQENKARREEQMARIPTYNYGDLMHSCRRWVQTQTSTPPR